MYHGVNLHHVYNNSLNLFLYRKGRAMDTLLSAPEISEEYQYLNLVKELLLTADKRDDRTGTGTLSTFGTTMRFSLRNGTIPLFTGRKLFWRGIVEELLWFIKGDTNSKHLEEKGVNIWRANTTRDFLDKRGLLHYEEGDTGPIYGFQWRHFGAKYTGMNRDYTTQGFDQLVECINQIKTNPNSRRIVMSAWNPADLNAMALPPCHLMCQFYVSQESESELSCLMYQRSGDLGLGVPFNIASYSLLTHMIAHICGLKAKEFIHVIGDTHIYLNHIEALNEQVLRTPYPFPKVEILDNIESIDDFKFESFKLVNYISHPSIKIKMAL